MPPPFTTKTLKVQYHWLKWLISALLSVFFDASTGFDIYTLAVTSLQIHIHLPLWHTLQSTHTCIYCTLYPNWHCRGIIIKDSVWCHSLIVRKASLVVGWGRQITGGRAKLDDPLRGGEPNWTAREGERDKLSRRPVRGKHFVLF